MIQNAPSTSSHRMPMTTTQDWSVQKVSRSYVMMHKFQWTGFYLLSCLGKLTQTRWANSPEKVGSRAQILSSESGDVYQKCFFTHSSNRISSLSQFNILVREITDLLVLGRPPLARPTGKSNKEPKEPYNRAKYWGYAEKPDHAFQELYTYCFSLVKPP